jgi:hypothetical protein
MHDLDRSQSMFEWDAAKTQYESDYGGGIEKSSCEVKKTRFRIPRHQPQPTADTRQA